MYTQMKFKAALAGIDLDNPNPKSSKRNRQLLNQQTPNEMVFKDPEEYKSMKPEEREALTEKMMDHWHGWANKATNIVGENRKL